MGSLGVWRLGARYAESARAVVGRSIPVLKLATGLVEESRRAGRQPVLRGLTADLMVDREAALRHVRMLITIHGFRLAELVPEAGEVEPREKRS